MSPCTEDREYLISIDPRYLQYGYLPLEGSFRKVLPKEPSRREVTLRDPKGNLYSLVLNNDKDLLEGEGLNQIFNRSGCPYYRLQVVGEKDPVFQLKDPSTSSYLKNGSEYFLHIDREDLEHGLLPLGMTLRWLLPLQPELLPVTFLTPDGDKLQLTLNNREGWLEGEDLEKLMAHTTSSDFRITVRDKKDMVFELEEFWPQVEPLTAGVEGGETSIKFHLDSTQKLLHRLKRGEFHGQEDFSLHQRARRLRLRPGFDQLISEPVLENLEPFEYQRKAALRVLKEMRGRALLCDEVGLGKTIEAGLVMTEYMMRGLVNKVLVLVPPSLIQQWCEEMRTKFNLDFVAYDSQRFDQAENGWEEFDRVVASLYSAKMDKRSRLIEKIDYDLVIVDEAHHLKNKSTLNWKFVNRLKKKFILLLTAIPVQNKLEELFNLITLLLPGQLETERSFKRKFITRGNRLKPKNTDQLRNLLREVMVRNKRSDYDIKLPSRYAHTLQITPKPKERKFYQSLTNLVRRKYTDIQGSNDGIHKFVLKTLQREAGSSIRAVVPTLKKIRSREEISTSLVSRIDSLLHLASGIEDQAKVEHLIQLVKEIEDRVIVFTAFRGTQEELLERLAGEGISAAHFHGGLRRVEKEAEIKKFRKDTRILVSTESGGEGRNLQFCRRMINFDLPWNPMRIEQRIGRIHRIGQTRDVFIYNFSTQDTIEAYILTLLDAKINMFELVIGELEMILGNVRKGSDFEELIMEIWTTSRDEKDLQTKVNKFGEELAEAKSKYQKTKRYDDELFKDLLKEESPH